MLTAEIVKYKGIPIEYDDFGFWTVDYCGDDVVFVNLSDAYKFIDEIFDDFLDEVM